MWGQKPEVAGAAQTKATAEEAEVAKASAARDAWENEEGGSEVGSGDDGSEGELVEEERLSDKDEGSEKGSEEESEDSEFLLLRGRLRGSNKGQPSWSRVLVVHAHVLNLRSAHTRFSRTLHVLNSGHI